MALMPQRSTERPEGSYASAEGERDGRADLPVPAQPDVVVRPGAGAVLREATAERPVDAEARSRLTASAARAVPRPVRLHLVPPRPQRSDDGVERGLLVEARDVDA